MEPIGFYNLLDRGLFRPQANALRLPSLQLAPVGVVPLGPMWVEDTAISLRGGDEPPEKSLGGLGSTPGLPLGLAPADALFVYLPGHQGIFLNTL